MNKRNIFRTLGFAVVLWGIGIVSVNNAGIASCVPQSGMTGMLQKALFAPKAACALTTPGPSTTCASPGGTCTLNTSLSPGNGQTGVCTQTYSGCACIVGSGGY